MMIGLPILACTELDSTVVAPLHRLNQGFIRHRILSGRHSNTMYEQRTTGEYTASAPGAKFGRFSCRSANATRRSWIANRGIDLAEAAQAGAGITCRSTNTDGINAH
jgi:hypothetical protein